MPAYEDAVVLPLEGAPAAGERGSARVEPEGRRGARPAGADLRAGPGQDRRLRAAAAAPLGPAGPAGSAGPWFLRAGTLLPDARRFADGPSPAAGFPAVGRAQADYPLPRTDPIPTAAAAAAAGARAELLASMARQRPRRRPAGRARHPRPPPPQQSIDRARPRAGPANPAAWIVRTALCVEPRDGRLHVFMPPVARWKITSNSSPRRRHRRAN